MFPKWHLLPRWHLHGLDRLLSNRARGPPPVLAFAPRACLVPRARLPLARPALCAPLRAGPSSRCPAAPRPSPPALAGARWAGLLLPDHLHRPGLCAARACAGAVARARAFLARAPCAVRGRCAGYATPSSATRSSFSPHLGLLASSTLLSVLSRSVPRSQGIRPERALEPLLPCALAPRRSPRIPRPQ